MTLLESKATAGERHDYRRCAHPRRQGRRPHQEHGQSVSPAEEQAIEQITAALGTTGS
jgi:hypothetical protein